MMVVICWELGMEVGMGIAIENGGVACDGKRLWCR